MSKERIEAKLGLAGLPMLPIPAEPPMVPDHELLRCIGEGSYGEVWLGRSVIGQYRAVKVVYRDRFQDARPYEREFSGIQKFEPLSRTHPSLVHVLQVGRRNEQGYFFYVMELADAQPAALSPESRVQSPEPPGHAPQSSAQSTVVSGGTLECSDAPTLHAQNAPTLEAADAPLASYVPRTLGSEIARRGRLPVEECVQLGLSLSLALGHLHRHGLIHRDVKPSNIIFVRGSPKLADIGLVTDVAAANSFIGTEGFIPPEGPNSPQADLYGLGKVLYEASMGKDRKDFPEPFTALREQADSQDLLELNAVLLKACATDKRERYQMAEEMHVDLALLQSGDSVRHKHAVERRLAFVSRAGAVVTGLALLAGAAFLYQRFETKEAKRLAEENRRQVARYELTKGQELLRQDEYYDALLWLAHALKQVQGNPVHEHEHRIRLNQVLNQCPKPIWILEHNGRVNNCTFSPDGKRLAASAEDGSVRVWDVHSGEPVTPLLWHKARVNELKFSPDNLRVLTASADGTAKVWEASTGALVVTFGEHSNEVLAASFSPDGNRVLTAGKDGTARVWDAYTGQPTTAPLRHKKSVNGARFSPDGKRVATASDDRTARIWDAASGKPVSPPLKHPAPVWSADFSPDGRTLATSDYHFEAGASGVRLWDADTGEPRTAPIRPGRGGWTGAHFSRSGRLLVTTSSLTARICDALTGDGFGPDVTFRGTDANSEFAPDGTRIITFGLGWDGMRIWDVHTAKPLSPVLNVEGRGDDATLSFSPDGRLLTTVGDNHLIKLWDLACVSKEALTIECDFEIEHGSGSLSTDGKQVLCCDANDRPNLYDMVSGRRNEFLRRATQGVVRALPSRDYKRLLTVTRALDASGNQTNRPFFEVHLWDIISERELAPPLLETNLGPPFFSREGNRIVIGTFDSISAVFRTCEVASPWRFSPAIVHTQKVEAAMFGPGGRSILTRTVDYRIHLWDVSSGTESCPAITGVGGSLNNAPSMEPEFSPDGSKLLIIGDPFGASRIWDTRTGRPLTPPMRHESNVYLGDWSPDGRRVVTGGVDGVARVWDAVTGKPALPPLQPGAPGGNIDLREARFSRNGRFILTAAKDGHARIWSSETGELITEALTHEGEVLTAGFSPDSRKVVTGGADRCIRVWDVAECALATDDLISLAEVLSGHRLGPDGKLEPLPERDLMNQWRTLRGTHPEIFEAAPAQVHNYYERELRRTRQCADAAGASFFLDRLLELDPHDSRLLAIQKEFLADQIPPRDGEARPGMIDLSAYYNARLRELGKVGHPDGDFPAVPSGNQRFANVTFDVRGMLIVDADRGIVLGRGLPARFSGIRIGQKCRRLHFLEGAQGMPDTTGKLDNEGRRIGSYVAHYSDGQQREIAIRYGMDVSDSAGLTKSSEPAPAWQATANKKKGASLRLYKQTWENPVPDVEITSIDFVSAPCNYQPALVAITAE